MTQSAVSQHVRSLEAFLGRELFIRRTRALHLTEAGANYLPTIREAFGLLASGTRAFRGGDRGRSLLVQCNLAFSVFWLAPRLAGLLEAHPWLLLNLTTPIWDPERSARSAEMEIRYGRPGEMSDAAVRLAYDRYYPVCRPGYAEGDSDWARVTALRLLRRDGELGDVAGQPGPADAGRQADPPGIDLRGVGRSGAARRRSGDGPRHRGLGPARFGGAGSPLRPFRPHVGGVLPDCAAPSRRDAGQPRLHPVAPRRDRAKRNPVAGEPFGGAVEGRCGRS